MNRLFYITGVLLVSLAMAPLAQAAETHIYGGAAVPRNARVPFATYHFRLYVEGTPLTQISVRLPNHLKVMSGIAVIDQTGQKIDTAATIKDQNLTIGFAQPVTPGTALKVNLNGVKTSIRRGQSWLLPVLIRSTGMTTDLPIGTVRIQTSSS
jgi:Protein of unknown function (DUF2808)